MSFTLVTTFSLLLAPPVLALEMQATASGKDIYASNCASCHGRDGKGGGPAAAAFVKPPTDLTKINERYGGKFPRNTMREIVDGQRYYLAHGSREMPVWGDEFTSEKGVHAAGVTVEALVDYLESIQAK